MHGEKYDCAERCAICYRMQGVTAWLRTEDKIKLLQANAEALNTGNALNAYCRPFPLNDLVVMQECYQLEIQTTLSNTNERT